MQASLTATALVLFVSFMTPLSVVAEEAEVQAARSATVQHNKSVTREQQKLEAAIERAKQQYEQQVIRTKERYLAQLDESLKLAMKNSNLDNANAINRQIERVKQQLARIKGREAEPAPDDKQDEKLVAGLKREYVGEWHIVYPTGFWRKLAVFPDGTVYVIGNKGGGIDVGQKYTLNAKGGAIIISNTGWNNDATADGTLDALKLDSNGNVRHLHFKNSSDYATGKSPEFEFTYAYKGSRKELSDKVKAIAGYAASDEDQKPADDRPNPRDDEREKLDFEDDTTAENPDGTDDDGFFGLPLE